MKVQGRGYPNPIVKLGFDPVHQAITIRLDDGSMPESWLKMTLPVAVIEQLQRGYTFTGKRWAVPSDGVQLTQHAPEETNESCIGPTSG